MKYIWGIYNIYRTPSAIPFPQKVIYSPPLLPPPRLGLESLELKTEDLKLI